MAITLDGTNGITTASADDSVILIDSTGSDSTDDARLELKTTNGTFTIQNDRSLGTTGALTFAGNVADNLVIDHATGNVGIGTPTITNAALTVSPTTASYTGYFAGTSGGQNLACRAAVDGNAIRFLNTSGTDVGRISTAASATAYATSSDYRLKENVQPMQDALAKIAQLNPVTYNWKIDGSDGQGFIAHELQAVVPDCVVGEKDAVDVEGNPQYQGVDTSFLVATLVKAIQEQQATITELTARIAALENTQ